MEKDDTKKEIIRGIRPINLISSILNKTIDDILVIINSPFENESTILNTSDLDLKDYPDIQEFKNPFWNQALSDLIKKFNDYYEDSAIIYGIKDENGNFILDKDGRYILLKDIKNADAQYKNSKSSGESFLVMPRINGNVKFYYEVRGEDLKLYAADSASNLLYSNEKKEYGRLLMPKNSRRVEIEDLNKNFWVISQVVSLIVKSLCDSESPLNGIIDGIIREIAKIWNNILMMWITLARIYDQLPAVYILPITKNPYCIDKRFDDFNKLEKLEESNFNKLIEEQCLMLAKKNVNSSAIIIPEIRLNNYYKNYYSKVQFPFYYVWEGGKLNKIGSKDKDGFKKVYEYNLESEKLWGFNDKESFLWIYFPLDRDLKEKERKRLYEALIEEHENTDERDRRYLYKFYCGLRLTPNITIKRNENFSLRIDEMTFTKEDVIEAFLNGNKKNNENGENSEDILNKSITRSLTKKTGNNLGFYLGEVLSTYKEINLADLKEE